MKGKLRSSPGQHLRSIREKLGLTMREVEEATRRLALNSRNAKMIVSPARLSNIENNNVAPSLFRAYALAKVYGCEVRDILSIYGLE